MKNYYERYIKPVTTKLSPDAAAELAYNETFREYMDKMRNPLFWMFRRRSPDVEINYVYWEILGLYARTGFINPGKQGDMQNLRVIVTSGKKTEVRQAYAKATEMPFRLTKTRFENMKFIATHTTIERLGARTAHK